MIRDKLDYEDIMAAEREVEQKVRYRLLQKGDDAYASLHETFGIVHEELKELEEGLQSNDGQNFYEELLDIAVACVIGLGSMMAWAKSKK